MRAARRAATAERQREASRVSHANARNAARDIGPLPAVVDQDRKNRCRLDFRAFCDSYYPDIFDLPWSEDHLQVLGLVQQAVLDGGLFAVAMPRGSGKTSIAERACEWALLYGHRRFVVLIGSDAGAAQEMLDSIKTQLDSNDLLAEDFPEVCHPIRRLEGISHRARGQLLDGQRTQIGWTASEIVLPTVAGAQATSGIVRVAGITGRIRGMKFTRPDGVSVRPDLVVPDDPQTDESARSPSQSATREGILAGAILGLAGPGKKIAGIMPCTVISPGDMADCILDRTKHPEWHGLRTKLIYDMPTDTRLWEQYATLRAECLQAGETIERATQFYRDNREAMDAGARVAWPERHYPDEASAIQHAMNLKLRDERTFWAEYQNEPAREQVQESGVLTSDVIAAKLNGLERGTVPTHARAVTAFVDIQQAALFYVVVAWADQFTGWVIDYGCWPEQGMSYFTLRDIKRTMAKALPGAGIEAQIYNALDRLSHTLMERAWLRDDGSTIGIQRMMIDANWQQSKDVVHQFCRASQWRDRIMPAHGRYYGASSVPLNQGDKKPGEIVGHNWKIPALRTGYAVRHVLYDTNFWKSFVSTRLGMAIGDPGCLSLWGRSAVTHRLFADHCTAEYRVRTEGRGRVVDEWKIRPERMDNHWWDGLVGCAVGAAMQGISMREWSGERGSAPRNARRRKRGVVTRKPSF